jgi:hypothetical protein
MLVTTAIRSQGKYRQLFSGLRTQLDTTADLAHADWTGVLIPIEGQPTT